MTLVTLRKRVEHYRELVSSVTNANTEQLEQLKGLPFYDWLPSLDGNPNTFNHAIGLPQKNGQAYPLFDYEQLLYDELQQHKHLWIKKATGLGVTEFMLRYMAWLCFNGVGSIALNTSPNTSPQMCIVTGPRIELAITLIDRMKRLFNNLNCQFDSKETVIELNGVHIEAYPSHHLDAMRGLTDVSFVYMDEADFFPPGEQQDARDVSERYIAKSNPWIVMVSTPNAPEQLFDRIEHEPESTCLYHRLFLDYTYGLGRIYTEEEIAQAKRSPSFEREYNLKYLGLIGNVFHTKDIEAAMQRGRTLSANFTNNSYTQKSVGIDPGYGSSAFGICVTELVDGLINVVYADEFVRADFNEMIETTISLLEKHNITFEDRSRIFVDGANPSFIRSLKDRIGEDSNYEQFSAYLKSSYGTTNFNLTSLIHNMFVIPVPFNREHKQMLSHCKQLMEYDNGRVAINPQFTKLITSLRTAVADEWSLDKEATSHDDLFDSFRLSLQFWH